MTRHANISFYVYKFLNQRLMSFSKNEKDAVTHLVLSRERHIRLSDRKVENV